MTMIREKSSVVKQKIFLILSQSCFGVGRFSKLHIADKKAAASGSDTNRKNVTVEISIS